MISSSIYIYLFHLESEHILVSQYIYKWPLQSLFSHTLDLISIAGLKEMIKSSHVKKNMPYQMVIKKKKNQISQHLCQTKWGGKENFLFIQKVLGIPSIIIYLLKGIKSTKRPTVEHTVCSGSFFICCSQSVLQNNNFINLFYTNIVILLYYFIHILLVSNLNKL